MILEVLNKKISKIFCKPYIIIGVIMIISFIIRLNYFPNVPLTLDSLDYFFYASDISINQKLPVNYTPANNGWPIFLSGFFSIIQLDNVISYMHLQRVLSIIISTITIVPIYYLCKKIFGNNLSLIGATIFAFEPRLIQNSLFGITDPLYIFLITLTLVAFLGSKRSLYLSFIFASFATLIRSEGIVLLITISILFFIKFKEQKNEFPKFVFAIVVMLLILVPMMNFKSEITGSDIIFDRAITAISVYNQHMQEGNEFGNNPILTGIENFSKYFIWDLIPIFIFMVPIGIFLLFKTINFNKIFIILGMILFSIPAFWAYSLPLQDSRYLYFMYPYLILISLYTLEKISNIKYSNLILCLIMVGILFLSFIYLEFKINNDHENEAYLIAKKITKNIDVVNSFPPESKFIEVVNYPEKWENFIPFFKEDRKENMSIRHKLQDIQLVDSERFENLYNMIDKSSPKLTHIVVDNTFNEINYLYDVYNNEEKYSFLVKEYDSETDGYKYHVKLFRIDYDKFMLIREKSPT